MRAFVVDDESLARRRVLRLLSQIPEVEVIGEAASAKQAETLMQALHVDILFLDVELVGDPESALNGFQLLERVQPKAVVFVSAYDKHAVPAFDVDACDFILKPATLERIQRAVNRAKSRIEVVGVIDEAEHECPHPECLDESSLVWVRDGDTINVIKLQDVVRLQASGDYTELRLSDGRSFLSTRSLSEWQTCLPSTFMRVHRSTIVSLAAIVKLERAGGGYVALLHNDREPVAVSRNYAGLLKQRFALG